MIAIQFVVYMPYGESLIEEHNTSNKSPYKFNGKEQDQETGLYYYGARYYEPKIGLFYGVDPLTEKYPHIGGYVYCYGNPIRFIDPDGRRYFDWDSFFKGIKDGYIAPAKNLVKAVSSPVETLKALDGYAATTNPAQMQDDMLNQMTEEYL